MMNRIASMLLLLLMLGNNCLRANEAQENQVLVSIITSIWNGDEFIEGFLADITRQTFFKNCELILINANSPGNEERVIEKYVSQHPNIRYVKLNQDPGLYGVWNMGIKMAKGEFITNANLDDRCHPDLIAINASALKAMPDIDLVYTGYYLTSYPNETFENNRHEWEVNTLLEEFSPKRMSKCLPGPQPLWRKSIHERYGYFDESFLASGDWEMWNRAVSQGAKFKKIPGIYGLIYQNPKGLSTDQDHEKILQRGEEANRIISKYTPMWNGLPVSKSSAKALNTSSKTWSILILTLESRKESFQKIYDKLVAQIEQNHLADKIEILVSCDKGEKSVGKKRNELLMASQGEYICYIDDDDDIHNRYIPMIYDKLVKEQPDCVSLEGVITVDGKNPKKFTHSIQYDSYFEKDDIYYRPPNHLNPIRREIAVQFKFPDNFYGEDTDWAMQICKSGLLKKEASIEVPYYFYLYSSEKND